MKKAVLFDLDGTLLDTLQDLQEAVNFSLEKHGYPTRGLEHVRKSIGNGVAKLIERCLPNGEKTNDYEEVLKDFREYYLAHANVHTKAYSGMKETLLSLKEKGYFLAVITNKLDKAANKLIEQYYPYIFDFVLGDVPNLQKKPNREMIDFVIKGFNLDRENTLYVGDTNVDYETATNSEVKVLLVTYGYRTKEELKEYHYDCPQVDSPKEILEFLEK